MADFSAQRACTRKFRMTSDSHDDGFQHPACLCCIFFEFFSWWWLGGQASKKSAPALIKTGDAISKPRRTDMVLTVSGALGSNAHVLSNMAWFLKYWICFWTGIIEDGWRISTLRRFWKYWIWKPYFPRRIRGGVSIQYFRNEGLLDICLWKFFSEARNAYPLFE